MPNLELPDVFYFFSPNGYKYDGDLPKKSLPRNLFSVLRFSSLIMHNLITLNYLFEEEESFFNDITLL